MSRCVFALMGILLLVFQHQAKAVDFETVRKGLEGAKAKVLGGRLMAEVSSKIYSASQIPRGGGVAGVKIPHSQDRAIWAYSGEKCLFETEHQVMAWDGQNSRARTNIVDRPSCRMGTHNEVRNLPMWAGYVVNWEGDDVNRGYWLTDLCRRVKPTLLELPGGKLKLVFQGRHGSHAQKLLLVLDPKRGYLAEYVEIEWVWPKSDRRPAFHGITRTWCLETAHVDDAWFPTKMKTQSDDVGLGLATISYTTLSNLKTSFSDKVFSDVFRPGDLLMQGETLYEVGKDGSFHPAPLPAWEAEVARQDQEQYWAAITCLAVVVVAGLIISDLRKRRRNRPE